MINSIFGFSNSGELCPVACVPLGSVCCSVDYSSFLPLSKKPSCLFLSVDTLIPASVTFLVAPGTLWPLRGEAVRMMDGGVIPVNHTDVDVYMFICLYGDNTGLLWPECSYSTELTHPLILANIKRFLLCSQVLFNAASDWVLQAVLDEVRYSLVAVPGGDCLCNILNPLDMKDLLFINHACSLWNPYPETISLSFLVGHLCGQ